MSYSTQPLPSEEFLIDVDEAAALLKLKRSTLYAHTSRRVIPHYKRGGKLYFLRSELIEWAIQGRREVVTASEADRHIAELQKGGAR
jgi:excisionase family DNA binding protein